MPADWAAGLDVSQDQRRLNPKIVSRLSVFVLLVLQVSQAAREPGEPGREGN